MGPQMILILIMKVISKHIIKRIFLKLKLDLHTHPWEAFNFVPPTVEIAGKIVNQIKSQGIDGIGITDHHNKEWGMELREIVEKHFPGQVIILPGW